MSARNFIQKLGYLFSNSVLTDRSQSFNSTQKTQARSNIGAAASGANSDLTSVSGLTLNGATTISGQVNMTMTSGSGIELGRVDGNTSTPVIDFHTTASVVDYNARLLVSGGTGLGNADVTLACASLSVGGKVGIGAAATAGTAGNLYLGSTTATTATAGSATLPSAPAGYLIAFNGTTQIKIPYYNA